MPRFFRGLRRVDYPEMTSRLSQIVAHLNPFSTAITNDHQQTNIHELNPTHFLPRAAAIEPNAPAILHKTALDKIIRRTYGELAERSACLSYFLKTECFGRTSNDKVVAVLASNTPMVLESYYAISGAGGVFVAVNYRLQAHEVLYILDHSKAATVIVDKEYLHLVKDVPQIRIIVDEDADGCTGEYEEAIKKGRLIDQNNGSLGWNDLRHEHVPENDTMCIAYTSGTTAAPKGVETTHRGTYLAALGNVVDSALNCADVFGNGSCKYLWTLPMFHAVGLSL